MGTRPVIDAVPWTASAIMWNWLKWLNRQATIRIIIKLKLWIRLTQRCWYETIRGRTVHTLSVGTSFAKNSFVRTRMWCAAENYGMSHAKWIIKITWSKLTSCKMGHHLNLPVMQPPLDESFEGLRLNLRQMVPHNIYVAVLNKSFLWVQLIGRFNPVKEMRKSYQFRLGSSNRREWQGIGGRSHPYLHISGNNAQ